VELHVEGETCIDFHGGETDGKSNEEDVGVEWIIIMKLILNAMSWSVEWILLA
jgi:hypothetical protein